MTGTSARANCTCTIMSACSAGPSAPSRLPPSGKDWWRPCCICSGMRDSSSWWSIRWRRSLSRYEETRRLFLVELTENGTDYQARDAADDEPAAECRQVACLVLEDAEKKLTQREILQQWPEDFPKPDLGSLSRALR